MALGLVLQQALIISTLVFLAILALWTQAGPFCSLQVRRSCKQSLHQTAYCSVLHAQQYHLRHSFPVQVICTMSCSLSQLCWHSSKVVSYA